MPEYHILNLGAGVQSTALYLLSMEGKVPKFDAAIFADTKAEPGAVCTHLKWLQSLNGPQIYVRSKGSLAKHLQEGINSTGHRFASIPAFTAPREGDIRNVGRVKRQCTKEYKIEVIDRCIRREILNLEPRKRIPRDVRIVQYYGISWDERDRATRIYERSLGKKWLTVKFPLFETLRPVWTRWNCESYLEKRVPHKVVKSACVFCPFRNDEEWRKIKANPKDWKRAVAVDESLRDSKISRPFRDRLYLHRTAVPLVQIDFTDKQRSLGFRQECDGVCGV